MVIYKNIIAIGEKLSRLLVSHSYEIEFERMIKFIRVVWAILALLRSRLNVTVNNIFLLFFFFFFRDMENLNNTLKVFTPASLMRSPCVHFHTRLISRKKLRDKRGKKKGRRRKKKRAA